MAVSEEIVELAARAMCAEGGFDADEVMANDGPRWRYHVPGAKAALSVIEPVPSEGLGTVSVKPLEWHGPDYEGEYWAAWDGETYVIRAETGNGRWLGGVGGYFPTIEAAQAAAQSDFETRVKSCLTSIGVEAGKPWFPPNVSDRPDGFECLAWHRGRWRHVRWSENSNMWMFGYGSAGFHDLGRLFAPLPWNTPEADFWEGEPS